MPIETPEAPKPSIEALRALLPSFIASAGIRQAAPHFAASLLASPQSLASPGLSYPVYALGLADVASGAGVRKAKLSAWRHEFTAEGEVVSRDVLLDEAWGYEDYPNTRTVDNHILKLRQKLEKDPSSPVHFRTVHGMGYKFVR